MKFPAIILFSASHLTSTIVSFAEIDFNKDIKPILSENCYYCHGPDENTREAKLRLDDFDSAIAEKNGIAAIVPNHPDDSELVFRIISDDPEEILPPPESKLKLTQNQKNLLKEWIKSGAKYDEHWAFIKPDKPKLKTEQHPIDELVAKTLKQSELEPSQEADPATTCLSNYF